MAWTVYTKNGDKWEPQLKVHDMGLAIEIVTDPDLDVRLTWPWPARFNCQGDIVMEEIPFQWNTL